MSRIDSSMDADLRSVMLSEIRDLLPAFLSAASVQRGGPVNAAAELLRLPAGDLQRALAVHAMLSTPVREFLSALPGGMRRPSTSSTRPRMAGRTVSSGIDWAATARLRATSSPLGDVWVTRAASRVFDVPENRALAWVLDTLQERGEVAVPTGLGTVAPWGEEIRAAVAVAHRARRTAWLEGVPPRWPGDSVYTRLSADRTGFYKTAVAAAARYLRHVLVAPLPSDVVDALSDRYFEPAQDWKLFEIAVLLRITNALDRLGTRVSEPRPLHDGSGAAFARFQLSHREEVRVWYQTWPPATRPSELDDAVRHYAMAPGGTRPDIVVEVIERGTTMRAILLELKASGSSTYLSSGFAQLLGYLRERPGLFHNPASAWLVAPSGGGFESKSPEGRTLWITSADDVADQLVAAVARSLTAAESA